MPFFCWEIMIEAFSSKKKKNDRSICRDYNDAGCKKNLHLMYELCVSVLVIDHEVVEMQWGRNEGEPMLGGGYSLSIS